MQPRSINIRLYFEQNEQWLTSKLTKLKGYKETIKEIKLIVKGKLNQRILNVSIK
jgi:hypothetical protein